LRQICLFSNINAIIGHHKPVQIDPSPLPYNVVLATMLAYTNPVVFKTTLKEGRGWGRTDTYAVV